MSRALPPLTWRPGKGWLVLIGGTSGGWPATEAIDRAAIAQIRRDGPCVFLPAAACPPSYGETFIAHYSALEAADSRVADVVDQSSANDETNASLLAGAALVYIGGGETPQLLASMAGTRALEALAAAYEAGAVIAGMSAGAIALATRGLSIDPGVGVLEGWGWLRDVVVAPHYTEAREAELRAAATALPGIGLGLAEDMALALGPNGESELWGADAVAVVADAEARA